MNNSAIKQTAIQFFKKKKIVTLKQFSDYFNCSIRTAQRRLKIFKVFRSYNKNSAYFVLHNIPKFDKNGLWKYKGIFFSKHGILKQAIIHLVANSEMGLDAYEIGKTVELSSRSFISHFQNIPGLCKEKFKNKFIYFSDKKSICEKQKRKRKLMLKEKLLSLPSDTVAIAILIDIIKHPNTAIENCIQRLRIKKINIKRETIQNFLQHHNIKKKLWL